jgi:hypothetical protein
MSSTYFQEFWGNFLILVIDICIVRGQDLARAEKFVNPFGWAVFHHAQDAGAT